ncbi:hypothetical protein C9374_009822 [Naegleria lovaniensis]|uniref:Uncharacterized protein n=1 Tax=Naegleria lovaniensis TaxID=51637 RepID=A0AA88GYD6_NAELO|nr:uncharacterized protein C9374_009822 [Naegleria lovaniensis]KAG2393245.1 hypothetical protein C9374_009822 [Naegleria lovaniensis]
MNSSTTGLTTFAFAGMIGKEQIIAIRNLIRKDPLRFILIVILVISIASFFIILNSFLADQFELNHVHVQTCHVLNGNLNAHVCTDYDCNVVTNKKIQFHAPLSIQTQYYPSSTIFTPVFSRELQDQVYSKSGDWIEKPLNEACTSGVSTCYAPSWQVQLMHETIPSQLLSGFITTNLEKAQQVLNQPLLHVKYFCFLNYFNDLTWFPSSTSYIPTLTFALLMTSVGMGLFSVVALRILRCYRRCTEQRNEKKVEEGEHASLVVKINE